MRRNLAFYRVLTALFSIILIGSALAVDTVSIDRVRDKSVLSSGDFVVIDNFIQEAIEEIVGFADFTNAARARAIITTRQSDQAQYKERYSKSLEKEIKKAMRQSDGFEEIKKNRAQMNLMILVSELADVRLIDIALGELQNSDKTVCYWAVSALSNKKLIEQIAEPSELAKIQNSLKAATKSASPEIASLMLEFAAVAKKSEPLLFAIADARIAGYAKWSTSAGMVDVELIRALCDKMLANDDHAKACGQRFGQLYSYAMQKYEMYLNEQAKLSDVEKRYIASMLIEVERTYIEKLTGFQQSLIKTAIQRKDANVIRLERERLLGKDGSKGVIPEKFGFDYGKDKAGKVMKKPAVLSVPMK